MKLREIIISIADELLAQREIKDFGLLGGELGIIISLYHIGRTFNIQSYISNADSLLARLIKEIDSCEIVEHSFCSGMAGIGWGLLYLNENNFIELDTDAFLSEIDDYLYSTLLEELKKDNYDFLYGSTGICLYFLKRFDSNKEICTKSFETMIKHLDDNKIIDGIGYKWDSSFTDRKNNISLSHGMSSIISILSKLHKLNIDPIITKRLLEGSTKYILKNKIDFDKYGSCFPANIESNHENIFKSRLAWCYGDLGISLSLWQAGDALKDEKIKKISEYIFSLNSERKSLENNSVVDAGICHGTAGIAQIYIRMYENTNNPKFKKAHDHWCKQTIIMSKFTDGLVGYKTYSPEFEAGWTNDYNLILGISGIALSLTSKFAKEQYSWDECFLIY